MAAFFKIGMAKSLRRSVAGMAVLAFAAAAVLYAKGSGQADAARSGLLNYEVTIPHLPAGARQVRVWLPVPDDTPRQEIGTIAFEGPLKFKLSREGEYGNRYAVATLNKPEMENLRFSMKVPFNRHAVRNGLPADRDEGNLSRYLKADTLVPVGGELFEKELSRLQKKGALPRRLYDHVVDTLSYDKSGQGWGKGDALRVCDVRTGNCTDFHSLFIGLARMRGLPARFVMGLPLPSDAEGPVAGYHCWAEYWDQALGWLPVDASEASKNPAKRELLFNGLDADRLEFSRGRDLLLNPAPAQGKLNYFFYPVVEVDGKLFEAVNTRLSVERG